MSDYMNTYKKRDVWGKRLHLKEKQQAMIEIVHWTTKYPKEWGGSGS
jgi:hypothetical protein